MAIFGRRRPRAGWSSHRHGHLADCRSGGPIVSVHPLSGSCALRARREPPSGSWCPPCGEYSCWPSRGSPPRFLAVRHGRALFGGVSPSFFPPLASACVRRARTFQGPLSSVALLAVFPIPIALSSGFVPPLLPLWVSVSCGHMDILGRGEAPRWLVLPPTRPPLLCTHNAGACRFQLWPYPHR